MLATCTARRPSTAPSALMTCHLRWSRLTFGRCVFISNPDQKRGKTSKEGTQVNTVFRRIRLFFGKHPIKSPASVEMSLLQSVLRTPNRRIGLITLLIIGIDQFTKNIVLQFLGYAQEKVVVDG